MGPLGLSVFYFFSLLIRLLVSVCHRSNTSLSRRLLRSLQRMSLRADITLTHGNSHPSPPGVCNATRGSCPAPESRKPGPAALASPGRGLKSCAGRSDLGQDPGGLGDGVPLGRGLRPTCEDSAPGTTRLWKSEFEGETSLSQKSVNIVKGQINSLIVSLAQSRVFPIHLSPGAAVRVLDASELDTGCASPTHGVGGSPHQARPRCAACRTDERVLSPSPPARPWHPGLGLQASGTTRRHTSAHPVRGVLSRQPPRPQTPSHRDTGTFPA